MQNTIVHYEGTASLEVLDRVTMQVFVRDHCTMIAAPVQRDVDGIPKGSHYVLLKRANVHVERPPSGESTRVPASPTAGRFARTCGWASLFSTSNQPRRRHARTFSTSVAICTNS